MKTPLNRRCSLVKVI